jgi:hypothetical protein
LRRILGLIALTAFFSGLAAIGLLFSLYPWHPTTPWGWAGLVSLGIPITIGAELAGKAIFENHHARSLGAGTKPGSVSFARVAYGVVAFAIFMAVVLGILAALGIVPLMRD